MLVWCIGYEKGYSYGFELKSNFVLALFQKRIIIILQFNSGELEDMVQTG